MPGESSSDSSSWLRLAWGCSRRCVHIFRRGSSGDRLGKFTRLRPVRRYGTMVVAWREGYGCTRAGLVIRSVVTISITVVHIAFLRSKATPPPHRFLPGLLRTPPSRSPVPHPLPPLIPTPPVHPRFNLPQHLFLPVSLPNLLQQVPRLLLCPHFPPFPQAQVPRQDPPPAASVPAPEPPAPDSRVAHSLRLRRSCAFMRGMPSSTTKHAK